MVIRELTISQLGVTDERGSCSVSMRLKNQESSEISTLTLIELDGHGCVDGAPLIVFAAVVLVEDYPHETTRSKENRNAFWLH
jgi:hypothetical protein